MDLVSRKWVTTLLSPEETATQAQVVFLAALEGEGLIDRVEDRLDTGELPDAEALPILLAVSGNGAPMTADVTKAFMALCSIAQHFGRPGVPTDQAPIESFFGHIKAEWPHLDTITDPDVLAVELERVRVEYNSVRLHAAVGYVTPDDEHAGRSAKHAENSPELTSNGEPHADPPTTRSLTMWSDSTPISVARSQKHRSHPPAATPPSSSLGRNHRAKTETQSEMAAQGGKARPGPLGRLADQVLHDR